MTVKNTSGPSARCPLTGRVRPTYGTRALGRAGSRFLAPKWIPGTADIIYADEAGRLVRRPLETDSDRADDTIDLGGIDGTLGIVVHPAGEVAALIRNPFSVCAEGGIDLWTR